MTGVHEHRRITARAGTDFKHPPALGAERIDEGCAGALAAGVERAPESLVTLEVVVAGEKALDLVWIAPHAGDGSHPNPRDIRSNQERPRSPNTRVIHLVSRVILS